MGKLYVSRTKSAKKRRTGGYTQKQKRSFAKSASSSSRSGSKTSRSRGVDTMSISAAAKMLGIEHKYMNLVFNGRDENGVSGATHTSNAKIDNDATTNSNIMGPDVAGEISDGTAWVLNAPKEGSGKSQRDGRSITVDSIQICGTLDFSHYLQSTSFYDTAGVVIALVVDHQPRSTVPSFGDVYDINMGTRYVQCEAPFLFRNMDYLERFTVLGTKYVKPDFVPVFVSEAAASSKYQMIPTTLPEFALTWKGQLETVFKSNNGTYADITQNAVYMVAYNCSHNTDPVPILAKGRVRFRG